jgi:ABC-type transport system involved in multi-copper enzyme maturation permease subunit
MTAKEPSSWQATRAMAALTWRRTVRSRTLWISALLALLPVLQGVALRLVPHLRTFDLAEAWNSLLIPEILLLAVLCPQYAAASLGDEIDSHTMTYLWSRPIQRWTIAAGKLLALTPIVVTIMLASAVAAMMAARMALPPTTGLIALTVGAVMLSVAATGIALLVPKHSMIVPMAYFLFIDLPVGGLPASLQRVSMTFHLRAIAEGAHVTSAAIWLLGLTAAWAAIGLSKLRTLE